jgi:hypothetical protein
VKLAACSLALLLGLGPTLSSVERLRAKVPVVGVSAAASEIAGKYSSAHPELAARHLWLPGGRNLYLFPDDTYVYCEWGDVLDETVFDKGTWRLQGSRIALSSSPDVTWPNRGQRAYVAVRRDNRSEILLVGEEADLPEIEAYAGDRSETALLLHSYTRLQTIPSDGAREAKAELLKRAWNPAFFHSKKR